MNERLNDMVREYVTLHRFLKSPNVTDEARETALSLRKALRKEADALGVGTQFLTSAESACLVDDLFRFGK